MALKWIWLYDRGYYTLKDIIYMIGITIYFCEKEIFSVG